MDLNERRARFIYDGTRLAAIAANAPIIPAPWDERGEDFHEQFRKRVSHQMADQTPLSDPEEIHDMWMEEYVKLGWVYGEKYDAEAKTHPDLVPYDDLHQLEKDKDEVWSVFCAIAKVYIYDI